MPKGKNQKFKLYRLAQIMLENTDEEHYITMPEIKEKLEEYEVTADRKSIYNDLKDLEKLGIEVEGEPVGNRYHCLLYTSKGTFDQRIYLFCPDKYRVITIYIGDDVSKDDADVYKSQG